MTFGGGEMTMGRNDSNASINVKLAGGGEAGHRVGI